MRTYTVFAIFYLAVGIALSFAYPSSKDGKSAEANPWKRLPSHGQDNSAFASHRARRERTNKDHIPEDNAPPPQKNDPRTRDNVPLTGNNRDGRKG
ncbi:hypothetical protein F5148DRAFT_1284057 [Russula earlei]|uniref:Uncharacterized protein n=1 Tax=Russula earlei TaxID=71964 RepID=A0ACC0UAS7_9AGAM|nr:hypothetical protein F5148DRAFT_1284057 [Russula earlei]